MTYENMKDSGAPWIGKMPSHWNCVDLKYLFEIKKDIVGEIGHTVLSITQQGIKPKNMSDKGQFALDYSKYQRVNPGDFAMNHMDLLTGWVDISKYSGVTSPDYRVFKCRHQGSLCPDFFKYVFQVGYMHHIFYGLGQGVAGFGRWRLPADMFLNYPLPVPPLVEQCIIASALDTICDKINEMIQEAQSTIDDYKRWKASVIYRAVTKGLNIDVPMKDSGVQGMGIIPAHWKLVPLKYVSILDPSCQNVCQSEDDEVSFAPMECIRTDKRIPKTAPTYKDNGTYSKFNNGDIAIAKVTPCFENGNICIMEGLVNGYAFGSSELFNVRAKAIQTRFLFYYMQSSCFINGAVATMTGVAGLKRVSSYYMRNALAPIPPNDEQSEIVAYLDRQCLIIDAVVDEKESLISELESYKKSLIYEAVTGKRKVV